MKAMVALGAAKAMVALGAAGAKAWTALVALGALSKKGN